MNSEHADRLKPAVQPPQAGGPVGGFIPVDRLDLELLDNSGRPANSSGLVADKLNAPQAGQTPQQPASRRRFPVVLQRLALACLPIAAVVVAFSLAPMGNRESRSPNWKYVQQAAEQTKLTGQEQLLFVNRTGVTGFAPNANFAVSTADINQALKEELRLTIRSGNNVKADEIFASANSAVDSGYLSNLSKQAVNPSVEPPRLPPAIERMRGSTLRRNADPKSPLPSPDPQAPTLTVSIVEALAKPDAPIKFVDFVVFDTCDADGDVVEVLLDGTSYGIIKLTNVGTRVNVAVSLLPAALTVRGVYDGGGENAEGITAGFSFRNAVFYARPLVPGEYVPICDVIE